MGTGTTRLAIVRKPPTRCRSFSEVCTSADSRLRRSGDDDHHVPEHVSRPHRGWVHTAIAIATLALIGLFARTVDWSRAWDAMSRADPLFVCLAVAVNLATVVIKAVRWRLFLAPIGVTSVGLAI